MKIHIDMSYCLVIKFALFDLSVQGKLIDSGFIMLASQLA